MTIIWKRLSKINHCGWDYFCELLVLYNFIYDFKLSYSASQSSFHIHQALGERTCEKCFWLVRFSSVVMAFENLPRGRPSTSFDYELLQEALERNIHQNDKAACKITRFDTRNQSISPLSTESISVNNLDISDKVVSFNLNNQIISFHDSLTQIICVSKLANKNVTVPW